MGLLKDIGKVGKTVLGVIAPTIASALPGPMGSIAKRAVTDLLGLGPGSSEEEIEAKLAEVSPEVLLQLRQADLNFKEQMAQLEVDILKIAADDRASARARQVALKDRTLPAMAWTIMVSWVGCVAALFMVVPPGANKDLLLLLLGVLTGGAKDVVGYFFGSSAGSARKTEMMNGGKSG